LYFVTFTVIHWLDVFIRQEYCDISLNSPSLLPEAKRVRAVCLCVIMSSHVHLIIGKHGDGKLEGVIRDIKKFTSVKIIESIKSNSHESRKELLLWLFERAGKKNKQNTHYQFWQHDSHPIELFSNELIDQKLDYIHHNPVTAGIVLSPEHYVYSSAMNYAGLSEQLIDVILI
jgi:hypothetical protein